jgi:Fur family peroxide stress response transcriptional regulator
MKKTKDDILKEIKNAGYRITKHRRAIIEFIAERDDHPSARLVFNKVKSEESAISLATVYNTLNMLVEMNLLKELEFDETDNRYDTNLTPHLNLVCTVCGSITDFEYKLPVAPDIIQSKEGFVTLDYRIEYRGVCSNCQEK